MFQAFYLVPAAAIFVWQIIKHFLPWLLEDFATVKILVPILRRVGRYTSDDIRFCTKITENARKFPHKPFLISEDQEYTYLEIDEWSNRCARALRKLGCTPGDKVGMMMMNEPAFVAIWSGCNKAGMTVAFLNFHLRQKSLLHCIDLSEIKVLIIGKEDELEQAALQIEDDLQERNIKVLVNGPPTSKYDSFSDIAEEQPFEDCPYSWRKNMTFDDSICYIFTSGTTGLPKAVNVNNYKLWAGSGVLQMGNLTSDDIVYTSMPLYHSAASLIGVGGVVEIGCSMVLRKKFSASQFIPDCRKYGVTVAQYVGETLRYVCKQPATSEDKNHKVRIVIGNGLRPDVWEVFLNRFGSHIHVLEFYAATEGNVGFFNIHNHRGCIGTLSPLLKRLGGAAIVKYDYDKEEMIRGPNGRAIYADYDEPGLLLGKISKKFKISSYKGKASLTEKKVIHDVFKNGDKYFNTGDLIKVDRKYRVSFCDRTGDTFRWRGENVSTNEVGDTISLAPGVQEANVYGVQIPGNDGRAGMAAIVPENSLDFSLLYKHAVDSLPSYARPMFLRLQKTIEVTGTQKQRKVNLKKDGYSLENAAGDQIYFIDNKNRTYVPLTPKLQEDIENGTIRV